eukprot:123118-Prymnesium_polylepis.1
MPERNPSESQPSIEKHAVRQKAKRVASTAWKECSETSAEQRLCDARTRVRGSEGGGRQDELKLRGWEEGVDASEHEAIAR